MINMGYLTKLKKFDKNDIEDILENSKEGNVKYLDEVLSIKNISSFDASYIMSKLNLTQDKIELIKLSLKKYESSDELKEQETYSDFLYGIVNSIEKIEKQDTDIFDDILGYKRKINDIASFADFLALNSSGYLSEKTPQEVKFSPVNWKNSFK